MNRVTFRDSSDGKTVTATFHLPGIPKEDVHISFQPDRLIVTWQTVKVTESQEGDRLVRERREKNYIRTLHLPDGTRFEEVKATMDSRNLLLTYPKMRPSQLVPIT
ncbi:hypothetical protein SISNIDRAFT_412390 [Sistotremastrum niveocremeum HHB9708]|uniref:SHSP domain-containing protein n=2 Tax=Sistotremastraceae TaxID=3402574 RepID=A0A164TRR7_9AGAM|nr:hypothetical protein SISNIDRAFT_412390 [Sistotremastrum niveocremeum HHB9708]KZT42250.1 hypothetical protein SISSUDRAFT_980616 [Sistotremastrum suecicum HHB10207 ss-3]